MWTTLAALWMSQAAPLAEADDEPDDDEDDEDADDVEDDVDDALSDDAAVLDVPSEPLELSEVFLSAELPADFLPESRLSLR